MNFINEDLKWINEVNRHPHAYVFRLEYNGETGVDEVMLIDDFTGETVYIFSEDIYGFLYQLLDYYGFKAEE